MKKRVVDGVFVILFGVVGLILFSMTTMCFSKISEKCTSSLLTEGLTFLLVLSAILVTLALSYMFCNWRGGNCYFDEGNTESSEFYLYVSAFLSGGIAIILATIGGTLKGPCAGVSEPLDPKEKKNGDDLRFIIWFMFGLCMILLMLSMAGLWYIANIIPGQLGEKKIEVKKESKPSFFAPDFFGGKDDEE
jgi:hypothetical protein